MRLYIYLLAQAPTSDKP